MKYNCVNLYVKCMHLKPWTCVWVVEDEQLVWVRIPDLAKFGIELGSRHNLAVLKGTVGGLCRDSCRHSDCGGAEIPAEEMQAPEKTDSETEVAKRENLTYCTGWDEEGGVGGVGGGGGS